MGYNVPYFMGWELAEIGHKDHKNHVPLALIVENGFQTDCRALCGGDKIDVSFVCDGFQIIPGQEHNALLQIEPEVIIVAYHYPTEQVVCKDFPLSQGAFSLVFSK